MTGRAVRAALTARDLRVVREASGFRLAVDALELRSGEVLAILGPNGAGKTTLLRCLAGLEAAEGEVVPRTEGRVTMVFQRPAAFSGSVAHNARVALLGSDLPPAEAETRAREALDRFGIGPLAERRARTLSGGELRRLALARAFALRPSVLLLDEPFDDLDSAGQASLSLDLRRVIAETGVAVAMVTHDLRRALLLADRIAVLIEGRLVQVDERDVVLERPVSPQVATLVGMSNLIEGIVADDGRSVEIDPLHRIPLATAGQPGRRMLAGIRPEDLGLGDAPAEGQAIGKGTVKSIVNDGVALTIAVEWAGTELVGVLLAGSALARRVYVGDPLFLSVRPERVHSISSEP